MLLSCLWALDSYLSFATVFRYIISAMFGFYLASKFSEKDLLSILAIVIALIAVSSFVLSAFFPEWGRITELGPNNGAWQGAFTSRNGFAIFMNIGFLIFAIRIRHFKTYRFTNLFFAALCAGLILMSRSATGLIILLLITALYIILPFIRYRLGLIFTSGVTLLCFTGLVITIAGGIPSIDILKLLGRSDTLSGRTHTWSSIFHTLENSRDGRFLVGYGAQDPAITSSGRIITEEQGRVLKKTPDPLNKVHSKMPVDNSYINILLKFGLIGSVLFAIPVCKAAILALRQFRSGTSLMGDFYIILMLILFINGITESVERQTLLWVLFALALSSPYVRKNGASDA
jgi:O-antigen ligase